MVIYIFELFVFKKKMFLYVRNQLPSVDLDQTSLYQLLRKSTAAMCSYCGYNGVCVRVRVRVCVC